MSLVVLLTAVCIVTYTFEIVFGLAGTILMLMVMSFFMDTKTLVIFSVAPQILVAVIGLWRSPRTVRIDVISKMVGFAILGALLGLYLFYFFSSEFFQVLLASTISLFGLYLVLSKQRLRLGEFSGRVLDVLAGMAQALFGISGPIAMTRMLASFDDKTVVRNYALAFFLSLNLFRAGGYIINNTITAEIGEMMLIVGPVLAVTLWFSNHLHFRINEILFKRVVAWIILGGGISLFMH